MSAPLASPAEFSDAELLPLRAPLQERYGERSQLRIGEAERRLARPRCQR